MKKILNPQYLPYFGALVQGILFSIAGTDFFHSVYGWLVGLGVGMVVNFSIALASSRYAEVAEKRKPLAKLALVGMFLLSPLTITLSLFFPTSIFTAIAWSVCVDLSIILAGAIVGKSLIPAGADAKKKPAAGSGRSAPSGIRSAKPAKGQANASAEMHDCPYKDKGCKIQKPTQNAINAHSGKCKYKLVTTDTIFETAKSPSKKG